MHDAAVMKVILFDNMRGSTIDESSKRRACCKLQVPIDQFALPTGRTHLNREPCHGDNSWMVATSDRAAQRVQEEVLGFLDHIWRDIAIPKVGGPGC